MKKIWIENEIQTLNYMAGFVLKVSKTSGTIFLNTAGSSAFRIFLNGKLIGYGPRRSAHGYSIINRYDISKELNNDDAIIVAEVVGYNNNSYNIVKDAPFFCAEILNNGQIIADSNNFKAYHITSKVQKCERYSFQRNFAEIYKFQNHHQDFYSGKEIYPKVNTISVQGNRLIDAVLPYSSFNEKVCEDIIEHGSVSISDESFYDKNAQYAQITKDVIAFPYDSLDVNLSKEAGSFKYTKNSGQASDVLNNSYNLYDLKENKTGFLFLDLYAYTDADIYLLFDEIIYSEAANIKELSKGYSGKELPLVFFRSGTLNAVKFSVKKGLNKLLTIEPYTLRYLKVIVLNGDAVINRAGLKIYENEESYKLKFETDDIILQKIFNAAQNTFAQNAVDVLTDCPSRERAGWLCDSFFSARAELLFTGGNDVEKNFLNNYFLMPHLKELPPEMLPMCYPSDHTNGNYIPNWSMWFVLEIEDYVKRTGDTDYPQKFKDKIINLAEFFINNFANEYGLLEKLQSWVFVEWSRSNDLVQDVNYPSNMLFCRMLKAIYNLYGIEKYNTMQKELKKTIIEQSYNGTFFEDNRKRINGKLERQFESTETCQYYAFYFDIADKNSFPELYKTMFEEFGPNRDYKKVYPEVSKSNAFIGNFLRLDYLMNNGKKKQAINEFSKYFSFMADRTNTLWEHDSPQASCCHGFASLLANWIIEALTGFKGFNAQKKEVYLTEPVLKTSYSAKIPLGNDFIILKSDNKPKLPEQYTIKYLP